MFSLYNLWVVARYEQKLLFRSWFFRIFGLVVVGLLTFLNIIFFTGVSEFVPWLLRGIPSSVPYFNLMMLNTVQAILCVFLASDFLKRDTKASTVEVIYMRSISNAEYVIGKTIGVISVFITLNLLVLLMGAIVNGIFADVPFQALNFLVYFLIISLPTMIFAIGIAFIFMSIFRNPPVTWVIMIGLVALTIFYLGSKVNYIFDFVAFYLPLAFSDFVGFSDLHQIILQRSIYLFFGLGFIFLTVTFMKRLPQSNFMNRLSMVFFVIFVALASFFSVSYVTQYFQHKNVRAQILNLNEQYKSHPIVSVKNCNLNVEHLGNIIQATAVLNIQNTTGKKSTELVFSLNPGFKVKSVSIDNTSLEFKQNQHLLIITDSGGIAAGDTKTLTVNYSGAPLDFACYPDLSVEQEQLLNSLAMYKLGKKHSFVKPDYVLLTRENLWYPVAGAMGTNGFGYQQNQDFIDFEMTVKTSPDLTVISQGQTEKAGEGEYHFISEIPLPQISLVIGEYQRASINVDSVEYELYTNKNHNYYKPFFTDIADTLEALIRDNMNDLEIQFNSDYPYKRLSVIEVPVHFLAFEKPLQFHQEVVQPAQVFLTENAVKYESADFNLSVRRQERFSQRSNRSISPGESQSQMFNMFVTNVFKGQQFGRPFRGNNEAEQPDGNLFPNFYTFINTVKSTDWPVLDKAFEAFMLTKMQDNRPSFFRRMEGLVEEEKANLLLEENSLANVLSNSEESEMWNDVLKIKSEALFSLIKSQVGIDTFDELLKQYLAENRFQTAGFESFVKTLPGDFQSEFKSFVENWYNQTELPAFYVSNMQSYKVLDNNRTRYQLRFDIQNDSDVDGVISVSFRMGGRGGFRGFGGGGNEDEEPPRLYKLDSKNAYHVGIVLDTEPRGMTINTLTSMNLPNEISERFEKMELNERAVPLDLIRPAEYKAAILPGEIVVDNEDDGFKVEQVQEASILKRFLGIKEVEDDEYIGLNPWRIPTQWKKTVNDEFWGKNIHSAYAVKKGNGTNKVSWTADIPSNGQYNIYTYINTSSLNMFSRRRGGPPGGSGGGRDSDGLKEFNYIIYHDDGKEEVPVSLESADDGWILLGNYYLSSGKAVVELSDKTGGRVVLADAIKWVKQ